MDPSRNYKQLAAHALEGALADARFDQTPMRVVGVRAIDAVRLRMQVADVRAADRTAGGTQSHPHRPTRYPLRSERRQWQRPQHLLCSLGQISQGLPDLDANLPEVRR